MTAKQYNKHLKVTEEIHHAISIFAAVKGLDIQEACEMVIRQGLAQTEQGLNALALADPSPNPQADLGLIPRPKE
jgi:hypothetical protein